MEEISRQITIDAQKKGIEQLFLEDPLLFSQQLLIGRQNQFNQADSLIFQTEKQLKEYGDKITEEKKKPIDEALAELKTAHAAKDLDTIDSAMEKLNTSFVF